MFNNESKYQIITNCLLSNDDYYCINKYYLPIIGPTPALLYQVLFVDLNHAKLTTPYTINILQSYLNISLDKIFIATKVLHDVGLVKTYHSRTKNEFIFELFNPLKPTEFFNNNRLARALNKSVGDVHFNILKSDISKIDFELQNYNAVHKAKSLVVEEIKTKSFSNYELYKTMLLDINPLLDNETIDEIIAVSQINTVLLSDFTTIITNIKTDLTVSRFKTEVNLLKGEVLLDNERIETKEELELALNNLDSELFLRKISNGRNNLSASEHALIKELRTNYKLNDSVINVLIHYVLVTNNQVLSENYVRAIAATWSRMNISNSSQAIKAAKEYRNKSYSSTNKNSIEPEWINSKKDDVKMVDRSEFGDAIKYFEEE